MGKWHLSSAREDWTSEEVREAWSPFRSFRRVVIPVILLIATLTSCSGKKRDFATGSGVIEDTSSDNPSAAGSANAGGPVQSDPTNTPGTEGGDLSEASLDTAAVAGTGLCDADAGCTCNDEVQSCDPLPLCDGGVDCTTAETCTGCLIEGECMAAESPNPSNFCQVCDPGRNSNGWSDADGATCDDGAFCTVDDACRAGECAGSPRECDDDVTCNGVSTCDENADVCTPGSSQCPANSSCDVTTGACVSTCPGCIVSGTCHATGAEEPGNPCRVCDPARSTSAFVAVAGKACGSPAGVCSEQDTCSAQGQCQPNHAADGAACGNPARSACDGPDSCDGRGNCLPRIAANSTSCDDGRFCSVGDACQGGVCSATGNRNCGEGLACNENADQCQCQGCVVGGNCFAAGALNGNNPCQICDPARSTVSFSGNTGARCGSGATECSAQDSCNAQGQCVPNDLPFPTPCTSVGGGQCQGDGRCAAPQPTQARLTVVANGTGTVTSGAGINCGTACSVLVNIGTQVTLQANTTNGSNAFFSAWSASECAGPARSCTVTVSGDRTVTATFSPMTNNVIFFSSEVFPTNLGGVEPYDAACNRMATSAGINSAGNNAFVALLSDSTSNVRDRLGASAQGWVRLDGKPFSGTQAQLFQNNVVYHPVLYDEMGNLVPGPALSEERAMTGTAADGTTDVHCNDWSTATTGTATFGLQVGGPGLWVARNRSACTAEYHLFCIGRARSAALQVAVTTGKRIWVTNTDFQVGGALSPDAKCAAERPSGVANGVALITRTDQAASEVLTATANYVRIDGQLVGTGEQLTNRLILTGIWQNADGSYRAPLRSIGGVHTGSRTLTELGTVASTCNNWTASMGSTTERIGSVGTVNRNWWDRDAIGTCAATGVIYCVEP